MQLPRCAQYIFSPDPTMELSGISLVTIALRAINVQSPILVLPIIFTL